MAVGVGVEVEVGVGVNVSVAVGEGVDVEVGMSEGVSVGVGVEVGVGVGVEVGVGVGVSVGGSGVSVLVGYGSSGVPLIMTSFRMVRNDCAEIGKLGTLTIGTIGWYVATTRMIMRSPNFTSVGAGHVVENTVVFGPWS